MADQSDAEPDFGSAFDGASGAVDAAAATQTLALATEEGPDFSLVFAPEEAPEVVAVVALSAAPAPPPPELPERVARAAARRPCGL
eukprot:6721694-Alexandrium_andersonii.AAC.1